MPWTLSQTIRIITSNVTRNFFPLRLCGLSVWQSTASSERWRRRHEFSWEPKSSPWRHCSDLDLGFKFLKCLFCNGIMSPESCLHIPRGFLPENCGELSRNTELSSLDSEWGSCAPCLILSLEQCQDSVPSPTLPVMVMALMLILHIYVDGELWMGNCLLCRRN